MGDLLQHLLTLGMLTLLQGVLGFDNLLYISLESKRAPADKQAMVRRAGIAIAIVLRIVLLFVLLYNFAARRRRVTGAVAMGLCRASSMLLGASVVVERVDEPGALLAHFYGLLLYVSLLTLVAEHETGRRLPATVAWWPFAALVIALPAEFVALGKPVIDWPQLLFMVLACALAPDCASCAAEFRIAHSRSASGSASFSARYRIRRASSRSGNCSSSRVGWFISFRRCSSSVRSKMARITSSSSRRARAVAAIRVTASPLKPSTPRMVPSR